MSQVVQGCSEECFIEKVESAPGSGSYAFAKALQQVIKREHQGRHIHYRRRYEYIKLVVAVLQNFAYMGTLAGNTATVRENKETGENDQ
jgi:hypothetical protein